MWLVQQFHSTREVVMVRVVTIAVAAAGLCILCSCVGKFSLIDSYYATPPEGESTSVQKEVTVEEEMSHAPQLAGTESAVEVIEEEPIK
jgi:hypothetical protein